MVGQRRKGNLLVQIGPRLQAYPEELIRQRRTHDGQTEYLIRWCLSDVDDGCASGAGDSGGGPGSGASPSSDAKAKNVLMWMTTEDVYANCPALLGKRKADPQREPRSGEAEATFDEVELLDMEEDVKNLVRRARKQMAKKSELSVSITHTIHVLSAYAGIGSLVGVFKETGALNLLMELLCSKETQTRRSASKMLRALASHDAGSRAHVLLSLSQQDGIEQHMDFDNRYTLLELFAETTSSEEHGISFDGVHLPQIPGKLLFSLVKRYLCVTSLMDKLNTAGAGAGADAASDRPEAGTSPDPSPSSSGTAQLRLRCEFDSAMAMANLISELVRVMGWDRKLPHGGASQEDGAAPGVKSIFQPRFSSSPVARALSPPAAPKKRPGNDFKTRSDFASRSAYVEYVQDHLKSGMAVRMMEDYEEVSAGDDGEFRYSNDGSPPVQVYWNALCRTYWVHWHMLEIVADGAAANGPDDKGAPDKASSLTRTIRLAAASQSIFSKPASGLYSLPYLSERPRAAEAQARTVLTRAEWWEILFFIKKLEAKEQREVTRLLLCSLHQQEAEMDDSALVGLAVPGDVAKKLVRYLKQHLAPSCLGERLCSHAFARHYLRSGGGEDDREPPGEGDAACSWTSSGMASVSKRAKKELPPDSSCDVDSQLPQEDFSRYPDGLEEKMKVFSSPRVLGKKTLLEKIGEVVDILRKGGFRWDVGQNLAGVIFITRLLEEKSTQEKNSIRTDSVQGVQDKVVKMLVELLDSSCRNVVTCTLKLTHTLMLRYEWRVSFATEGGVRAILTCMREMAGVSHVQQLALAAMTAAYQKYLPQLVLGSWTTLLVVLCTSLSEILQGPLDRGKFMLTLKVLIGATKYELCGTASVPALSESGTQMMLEIFASIGSATPEGSKSLLDAIPAALDLMLRTQGCAAAVRTGILVIVTLVSDHKSLALQLVSCNITAVLEKCLALSQNESILAIVALNHIFMVQKVENKDPPKPLDLKDTQVQKLLVTLKGITATAKDVIQTLEQVLCGSASQLEGLRSQVSQSHEIFQDLLHPMEQLHADRSVQLSIVRILNKFLDSYQEDSLPWHDSIKPCLASMTAFIGDKEVVQQLVLFLYRVTCVNKDYAVVMCRLGAKEVLMKAQDKHGAALDTIAELRDVVADCDKYASLYNNMTTSVLAGCIQMVLGQIEEHRRSHEPINIPFFDVFLRNLCQGSSVELKEDKCWEKVEVSSNHHRANKLSDKNSKTYWESNGPTGSHFINIFMHRGVVIRQLAILVSSEDSSYMPARILVLGGDDPGNINTELNTVNVTTSASRVVLLENVNRFWAIIQIRIKRCQQGGIDTRVHGFEVLGPKNTFWPVFKEHLCCRTFLFYSTKAHSWCQEVTSEQTRLLQLFNKLNSALRHEQMFAERFLADAEAAESLGRTCWEALVTPIVRAITSSGSGSCPLSWLLVEYLDNSDSAHHRCKGKAAVFNSRARRLTHLLVHVDAGPADPDQIQPPVKSHGKETKSKDGAVATLSASSSVKPTVKNSTIGAIALCWQEVVQQQVRSFLEGSFDHPDFVERYRNLYVRLKTATEELFGHQTAFVLALRHGFSAALLQLSILRAMHVSERFAQYMDQMLHVSGVEALEKLELFLEPMLFLSGLELANTFEHFYRYYLADRLLGRANVRLEAFVVEQLGSCFPNRFPQQMLKNLSESADLRRDFHLYRLQQLDRTLHGQQVVEEDEDEDEEESLESETDVTVLLLSPRCWTVSSLCFMDAPSRHFPARLGSYLVQFADFYCRGQSTSAASDVKPPGGLQWTWLGHADVSFGSLTLHVSTLQMFILLQFNTQEEVGVGAVLKGCGLSKEVVLHALQPLIEDENGPLVCSHPRDPCQGALQVKQQVACGPSRHVELQPRQTYLNVDKDAAAALETKRNFIYCLIVNILKQEKEMHIDNLVFKVLHSCHKREAAGSGPSGFSCSTGDVLSCIMHVMSKGCVRRHPEQPHMVQFLPDDPSTPQKGHAHLALSANRGSSPLVPAVFLDGMAVDFDLFSSGRSMTPEEVSQLMRTTVQQVAATLSVDPDHAEHLLLHCGWNVDLLVRRYTDDPDAVAAAAGLKCQNTGPPPGPESTCPVCLVPRVCAPEPPPPSLSCTHYCCRSCWREYLNARVEQNLVTGCNCPIPDCQAQPTSRFFLDIVTDGDTVAKYEKARLRGFVESCSNLTWCTNPQGCDQILCKENMGSMATCSKCCWSSCFNCNFPEAHYPASCGHMSQWMDDGGFYEGMSVEAQSKHLAKLISKRCPSCQAQIEKNEGCLHMTCAKCSHGFCWRCLKAWKPTHKDYYNCSATVSKVARQEKLFQDFNERCTFQHQAKDFAVSLEKKVSSINEALQMKSLTFVIDACQILAQARKVLAYSCVYTFYNQDSDKTDVMEQQTDALDLHTNTLQILLEGTLLQCSDLASCVRLLKAEHLNTGLELMRRIQERLLAILQHSTQDFRVGCRSQGIREGESARASDSADHDDDADAAASKSDSRGSDNNNCAGEDEDEEYDEDYVPEWHEGYEDYDEDEDDFFSDDEDDDDDNLERDFSPFD